MKTYILGAIIIALLAGVGVGSGLPLLAGEIILRVEGAITQQNSDGAALFDREMLASLPQYRMETTTPWTEGLVVFEGVLLKDLLDAVGATGTEIVAHALNRYEAALPVSDMEVVPIIVATTINGQALKVRDKGPLWIVYDLTGRPDLDDLETHAKMVWHLTSITVR